MYRFYKNYLKTTLNQLLFKNSFVALNLLRAKNSLPSLYKGAELVTTSSITKKTLKYFDFYLNPRLRFLSNQLESHTLLVSVPLLNTADLNFSSQSSVLVPTFADNIDSWSHVTSISKAKEYSSLLSLLNRTEAIFFSSLISIYKTLVLLVLRSR